MAEWWPDEANEFPGCWHLLRSLVGLVAGSRRCVYIEQDDEFVGHFIRQVFKTAFLGF